MLRNQSMFAKRRALVIGLVALLVFGGTAYSFRSEIRNVAEQIIGNDYQGTGTGETTIEIVDGDDGEAVAQKLVAAGVVKSFRATYRLILETNPTFYPGTYRLAMKMSSRAALAALSSESNAVVNRVTIKEGLRLKNVFSTLSKATAIPVVDFENAANNLSDFNLPTEAPSLEGYLFPATYNFGPKSTAKSILLAMRSRMDQELVAQGVAPADTHRVLTLAGLIQKEARIESDFYKVSRTFLNRIEAGMKLQSDATVSYGVDGNTVSTSASDRSNDNRYNTYRYAGLPVGPISAPGAVAIHAALNPAVGKWLYFCAVNLETGETVFSETYAQHQVAVRQWQAWMKENPGYE